MSNVKFTIEEFKTDKGCMGCEVNTDPNSCFVSDDILEQFNCGGDQALRIIKIEEITDGKES